MITLAYPDAGLAWRHVLREILEGGLAASPRASDTLEVQHNSVAFPIARPVVDSPRRKVRHRFAAAEALWIVDGRDSLAEIEPYNRRMAEFADGGTLWGAYGPRFRDQADYAVLALVGDPESRQAVVTLWRPEVREFVAATGRAPRDVPCTIALTFLLRRGKLHAHVFMRSSDAWLGIPYDFFAFSVMALWVAAGVNEHAPGTVRAPGLLHWTAASSHLYARDLAGAREVLAELPPRYAGEPAPPGLLEGERGRAALARSLLAAREGGRGPWAWRPDR